MQNKFNKSKINKKMESQRRRKLKNYPLNYNSEKELDNFSIIFFNKTINHLSNSMRK